MRYSKKQSERVHYARLSNLKSNIPVTRKHIIAAVVTSIVLMFFSACLWRLLRHAPKIKCETCTTLTTVSPEHNSNTARAQSRDLTMLSTLQVSKHTSTFHNVVIQHASPLPLRGTAINISPNVTWTQDGVTVAGGNRNGSGLHQLSDPHGFYVDENATVYIADCSNHRIVEWKSGAMIGQVTAGGNGEGNRADQLNNPTDVIVDNESLIICDYDNRRVVRWPLRGGTSGKTIITSIDCSRLTMDEHGFLYVSHHKEHVVKRWRVGESHGTVVAGGNGKGDRLNQLSWPMYIFVDRDHSVYVSDTDNHRVMKWLKGGKEGIIVAGGRSKGDALNELDGPRGVVVDQLGTVYVADDENHRIMCWRKGATVGNVLIGGNGEGGQPNQLHYPNGLSFDRHGNLYVADLWNSRVQRFNIE